jgi:hypothetical protein
VRAKFAELAENGTLIGAELDGLVNECQLRDDAQISNEVTCLDALNAEDSDWYKEVLGTMAYFMAQAGAINDDLERSNVVGAREGVADLRVAITRFNAVQPPEVGRVLHEAVSTFLVTSADYLEARVDHSENLISSQELQRADDAYATATAALGPAEEAMFVSCTLMAN